MVRRLRGYLKKPLAGFLLKPLSPALRIATGLAFLGILFLGLGLLWHLFGWILVWIVVEGIALVVYFLHHLLYGPERVAFSNAFLRSTSLFLWVSSLAICLAWFYSHGREILSRHRELVDARLSHGFWSLPVLFSHLVIWAAWLAGTGRDILERRSETLDEDGQLSLFTQIALAVGSFSRAVDMDQILYHLRHHFPETVAGQDDRALKAQLFPLLRDLGAAGLVKTHRFESAFLDYPTTFTATPTLRSFLDRCRLPAEG